jgi:hypothetical protein
VRHHLPPLNFRVFTVLVIVSLPLLVAAATLVLGVGQAKLRDSYGTQLAQVAEHTAAAVDTYVYRRIIDAQILSRVGEIRAAAASGNSTPFDLAKTRALDQAWAREPGPVVRKTGVLDTPASRFLREIVENDRIYREIFVTDRSGRLVAASNVTSTYYQANDDWWREAFDDGVRGRVSVGDVTWDESSRSHAVEIAMPVFDRPDGNLVGVMKVVADARELLAAVGSLQMGVTGEAMLIRPDGTVVYNRGVTGTKSQFFAADLLRERLKVDRGGDPQYRLQFSALNQDGRAWVVAIAPSQLSASYPHLAWMVAVTQAEDELFAPVRAQWWHLLAVFALVALVVLAVAAWFSVRLAAPSLEPELHVYQHPDTPRARDAA